MPTLFLKFFSVVVVLALCFQTYTVFAQSANYSAPWWTIDGGGGSSTGSNYQISGAIGQPDAGKASGGSYAVLNGYWVGKNKLDNPMEDLSITGMEITQGIQRAPNASPLVSLVAEKETWVRVNVRSSLNNPCNIAGRLHLSGDAGQTPTVIEPANGMICTTPSGSQRAVANDTLNFYIPVEFRHGKVTFEAEINANRAVPETEFSNNSLIETRSFIPRDALDIVFVRINYQHDKRNDLSPVDAAARTIEYVQRTYPIPRVNIHIPTVGETYVFNGDLSTGAGDSETQYQVWNTLLNQLTMQQLLSTFPSDYKEYGLIPDTIPSLAFGGLGGVPGSVAIGIANHGEIMAHEVGHNFGRQHTDCPDPNSNNVDPAYPIYRNPQGVPYTKGSIGEFGFHSLTQTVYDPASSFDFMSYCGPKWVSPYTYEALFDAIGAPDVQAARVASPAQSTYLLMIGEVNSATDTGTLGSIYMYPKPTGTNDAVGEGDYRVDLQDAQGQVLFMRNFVPNIIAHSGGNSPIKGWNQVMPFITGAQKLVLSHAGKRLDERLISAHAPTITLLAPQNATELTGLVEVRWQSTDADGDNLLYSIQYSADGGETWYAAAVDLTGTSYALDTTQLAGTTQGKLRILATDGVNTTAVETTQMFTVANKPPVPMILQPQLRHTVPAGQLVVLAGTATDREDGLLSGAQLAWQSSIDGALGNGAELDIRNLSVGEHQIALTAIDSKGVKASVTTMLRITSGFVADEAIVGLSANNDSPVQVKTPVHFTTALQGGTNLYYFWDFGDGNTATGSTATHVYLSPGVYTAQVTASNGTGSANVPMTVTVTATPPQKIYLPVIRR